MKKNLERLAAYYNIEGHEIQADASKEFAEMYPIHLRRNEGHKVSAKAKKVDGASSYWYAVMKHCGL